MFGATANGSNDFFKADGTSTFADEGWVKGLTFLVDLYKNGYAPKDSVNWGFNEIVAGFYSGTCAMLDQDPDALIAIAEKMKPEDYGVTTMPKGPNGKTFPTIMPTYLEEFAFFKDSLVIKTSQEALLGDRSPEDVAKEWAEYMTKAQQKHLKK